MSAYDDCKQQILDWIKDQQAANVGVTDVIDAYEDLTLQIHALVPFAVVRPHDLTWIPCSKGGLWQCRRCDASYCAPPWTKDAVLKEPCKPPQR